MKPFAVLVPLLLAIAPAFALESGPSKADCDAVLTAEVKRLEDGFSRTRIGMGTDGGAAISGSPGAHPAQLQNARATFNDLVMKLSSEHVKAVALPGIYRMMLAVPRYDIGVCSKPHEMRSIGDQAIAGFLLKLTQLLPLVEKT